MKEPTVIRTAIVEDRRDVREGLAQLIGGTEGFECTGCYRSMEEALLRIGHARPDVTLIDIGLPGMSGMKEIGSSGSGTPSFASSF